MVALLMLFSFLMVRVQVKYEGEYLDSTNKTSGLVLQLIQGIAKFRVAGAENRAFKQWADRFSYSQKINIHREKLLTITTTVTTVAPLVFSMIFYYMVLQRLHACCSQNKFVRIWKMKPERYGTPSGYA